MAKKVELSPLRSIDDFLLGSARFQLPNYRDLEKWGNRVVQNLLYYQTNYFLLAIIIVFTVTLLNPLKMLSGGLSVVVMYGLFNYFINASSTTTRKVNQQPKKNHKLLGVILILSGAFLTVYLLDSLVVFLFGIILILSGACLTFYLFESLVFFLFGILLPISTIFIHASLRLRTLKNKLSNIERVVHTTPMGVFLESLGMKSEFLS